MDWKYSVNIQWDIHRMDTGQWSCDLLSHFLWHHPLLALRRVTVSSDHLAVLIRLVQKQRRIMRERLTKNVEKYGLLSSPLPRYGLFPRTFAPHFCFGNKTTNLILAFFFPGFWPLGRIWYLSFFSTGTNSGSIWSTQKRINRDKTDFTTKRRKIVLSCIR